MYVSVTGVSHHETPVELRERFAFNGEELVAALSRMPASLGGGAILSTCNRSELYLASERPVSRDEAVAAVAAMRGESSPEGVTFYHYEGPDAVRHLFRVAAGI